MNLLVSPTVSTAPSRTRRRDAAPAWPIARLVEKHDVAAARILLVAQLAHDNGAAVHRLAVDDAFQGAAEGIAADESDHHGVGGSRTPAIGRTSRR